MTDFLLKDDQNVDVAITVVDNAGNPVSGVTFDAGSVTATVSNPALVAVVDEAQTSVNIAATGPIVTGDTVIVNGTVNSVAMTAGELIVDTEADAPSTIVLTPGTPVQNEAAPGTTPAPAPAPPAPS